MNCNKRNFRCFWPYLLACVLSFALPLLNLYAAEPTMSVQDFDDDYQLKGIRGPQDAEASTEKDDLEIENSPLLAASVDK